MAGGYSVTSTNDLKTAVGMSTGDILFCNGTRFFYRYDSASTETEKVPWVISSNIAGRWLVTGNYNHQSIISIPDADTISPDFSLSQNFIVNMIATRATRLISAPTNLIDGLPISIILKQPASPPTGGCKITLSTIWVIVKNNLTLNATANGYSLLQGIYHEADAKILGNITPF